MSTLIDSYSESNANTSYFIGGAISAVGQSFTGLNSVLDSATSYLKRNGSPTGNIYAKIYAHTGTYGTSSLPTGSALAISDAVDISTLGTFYSLVTFEFTTSNKILINTGTRYVLTIEYTGGDASNYLVMGLDSSSPTHSGNMCFYTDSWSSSSTTDMCFYIYGDSPATIQGISSIQGISNITL